MPKPFAVSIDYPRIVAAGLALPEVVESTSYGTPALKLRGKLMVRLREDNETLVLAQGWEDRERLMAIAPQTFFTTPHYQGYAIVLVRFALLDPAYLGGLLQRAWRQIAPPALLKKYAFDDPRPD